MPTKPKKPTRKNKPVAKKAARRTKRTPAVIRRILDGLSQGTPLSIICAPSSMPGITTVWEWQKKDADLAESIARARESGFDRIALDAMAIADAGQNDTIAFEKNGQMVEIPDKEWIMRSKLRVETRLKLLSKWDPKRYGDKLTTEISGPDGKPIRSESSHTVSDEMQEAILARTLEAAWIAANIEPPASFLGDGAEG